MSNTKCPRCGLVNWLTPEVCERCGLPLGGVVAEARAHEPARPDLLSHTFGSEATTGSAARGSQAPPVWTWYVAFCVAMALMYLVLVLMGLSFMLTAPPDPKMSQQEAQVMGAIFIVLGVALAVPFAAAPFLPRRKWTWVLGIVLIGLSMSSACCLPAAIPLLIFWLKPETKAFFGMSA